MNDLAYTTFYILRHAESKTGKTDVLEKVSALTEKGVKQAQKRAIEFKNIKVHTAFCSDIIRAKRTA